jgi:ABC-type amino acid transport substrate-binding protein
VRTYDLIDDAFNALEAGQVEAVINDCPVSKYAERAHKNLVVVQAIQTNEEYGIAFQKGSDELRTAVNEQLAKLKDNGELEKISNKWFGARPCALRGL